MSESIAAIRGPLRALPAPLRYGWMGLACLLALVAVVELAAAGVVYRLASEVAASEPAARLALIVAGVFLARALLVWWATLAQARLVTESIASVFATLLAGYLAAPYRLHLRRSTAEPIQRLTTAVDVAYRLVLGSAAGLFAEVLVVVTLLVLLLAVAPPGLSIVAGVLIAGAAILLATARRSVAEWGRRQYEGEQRTIAEVQDIVTGLREIKTGQREAALHERITSIQREMTGAMRRHLAAVATPRVLLEVSFAVAVLAIVVVAGAGSLPLLALFAYVGLRLIPAANRVIYHLDHIRHGAHAAATLTAAMEELGRYRLPIRTRREVAFRDVLELDDVSFTYPGSTRPAVDGATLRVRRGEWVGLAGENGSGKSTLLDLIAGILQPDRGSVRADGRAMEEWLASSPPLIAYVAQRPHHFDQAPASGGEQQRAAIEGAMTGEPEIVLLDEPTTALDAGAELAFVRALEALRGRITVIVVSHRPEVLRLCDRIVQLRGGVVYEPASSSATMARI
ncbi:MAG TPA: ATP-binding cassette domain-containing protein [Thermoanaerobaculia bacterium]|nr:ATP-binding cassette domain-containing protein [Thermoanaerobaculia bacterium]